MHCFLSGHVADCVHCRLLVPFALFGVRPGVLLCIILELLHQTKKDNEPTVHRANVYIICDCVIESCKPCRVMYTTYLKMNKHRLGVQSYEDYHNMKLNDNLKKQYHIPQFWGMLLSRRLKMSGDRYRICMSCQSSIRSNNACSTNLPNYAIANGFATGEFPEEITQQEPITSKTTRTIDVADLTDELNAIIAPVWTYGWVFA